MPSVLTSTSPSPLAEVTDPTHGELHLLGWTRQLRDTRAFGSQWRAVTTWYQQGQENSAFTRFNQVSYSTAWFLLYVDVCRRRLSNFSIKERAKYTASVCAVYFKLATTLGVLCRSVCALLHVFTDFAVVTAFYPKNIIQRQRADAVVHMLVLFHIGLTTLHLLNNDLLAVVVVRRV